MVLRKLRWLSACVLAAVALLAAPGQSQAGTQILIEETDAAGNAIAGTTQFFTGTSANYATTNFQSISVTVNPNSGAISSLTTNVGASPVSSGFDATHQLRVVVTSDGFTTTNAGGNALVANSAGASNAIGGGQNILSNQTQLLNVPLSPDTTQTGALATGTALGLATDVATDTRPGGGASAVTGSSISGMPAAFAIQQTILVKVNQTDPAGIASGSTLGGTAGSLVVTSAAPVPAPAGLLLGLTAIPVLGLRRFLRRKSA